MRGILEKTLTLFFPISFLSPLLCCWYLFLSLCCRSSLVRFVCWLRGGEENVVLSIFVPFCVSNSIARMKKTFLQQIIAFLRCSYCHMSKTPVAGTSCNVTRRNSNLNHLKILSLSSKEKTFSGPCDRSRERSAAITATDIDIRVGRRSS